MPMVAITSNEFLPKISNSGLYFIVIKPWLIGLWNKFRGLSSKYITKWKVLAQKMESMNP